MLLSLETTIAPFGPAAAIVLSDQQIADLGGGKRAAVRVLIAGREQRLRLAVMGGQNVIGLSKAARAALKVEIGDVVDVEVALDEAPREVEVPEALAAALAGDTAAAAAFDKLAYTSPRSGALMNPLDLHGLAKRCPGFELNLDLSVPAGYVMGLVGANGSSPRPSSSVPTCKVRSASASGRWRSRRSSWPC